MAFTKSRITTCSVTIYRVRVARLPMRARAARQCPAIRASLARQRRAGPGYGSPIADRGEATRCPRHLGR